MIAWVRTILFRIVFYSLSLPIVATVPVSALFGQQLVIAHSTVWTLFHRWCARVLLGIHIRVEGTRPVGPALYASKHQAMFETLELQALLDGPAMVLKEELADIPLWGWAARRYGALVIEPVGVGEGAAADDARGQGGEGGGAVGADLSRGDARPAGRAAAAQVRVRRAVPGAGDADGAGRLR